VLSALAAAKALPQLSLADALELTVLVARKDPRRHQRVAARWLLRYLEEHPHATIDEAVLAASSLVALTGVAHQEAAQTLRAIAERAPLAGDGLERVSGGGPAREQALRQRRLRAGEAGVVVGLNGPDAPIGSNHNGA
jgi:hypothetical protein